MHPGHIHLQELAGEIKGYEAGGVPFEFNTIAICDGSRRETSACAMCCPVDIIADSIELIAEAQRLTVSYICVQHKIVPGMLMAARLPIPRSLSPGP